MIMITGVPCHCKLNEESLIAIKKVRLNKTDKLNNMHRETVYYNREVTNESIGLILLLPPSVLYS